MVRLGLVSNKGVHTLSSLLNAFYQRAHLDSLNSQVGYSDLDAMPIINTKAQHILGRFEEIYYLL